MAETKVDWRFDVPPELGLVLQRTPFNVTPDEDDERIVEFVEVTEENLDDVDSESTLEPDNLDTPTGVTVVSQQINTLDDGTQLVDLVIDIDDVLGASKYYVKYVKV